MIRVCNYSNDHIDRRSWKLVTLPCVAFCCSAVCPTGGTGNICFFQAAAHHSRSARVLWRVARHTTCPQTVMCKSSLEYRLEPFSNAWRKLIKQNFFYYLIDVNIIRTILELNVKLYTSLCTCSTFLRLQSASTSHWSTEASVLSPFLALSCTVIQEAQGRTGVPAGRWMK